MEYTAVIRGVLVVNLKELHHEFFIAITNCNIGCFQYPNHFLLVVDSEALIGEIIFGCLTDCLVDVVSSLPFSCLITSFRSFERCCVPLSLCLYYIMLFHRSVVLLTLVIFEGQRKNEPKLARFSDRVADFKSPQSEASALVYKMLERSKNGKKELFSFGVKEAEKLFFSQWYVILLL